VRVGIGSDRREELTAGAPTVWLAGAFTSSTDYGPLARRLRRSGYETTGERRFRDVVVYRFDRLGDRS